MVSDSIFLCRSRTSTPSPAPRLCWPTWWRWSGIWMRRGGRTRPTTTWSRPWSCSSKPGPRWPRSEAGAVAEADHRDLGKPRLHYGSTGDWLTHLGGLRKGEGRRVVARAHALTGPLASTREAMAAGTVSPEQADVSSSPSTPCRQDRRSGAGVKPPCSSMRGASTPPTSPAPGAIWCMWSTPTPWIGSSSVSWTARNAPPTWADTSPSSATEPAGSGSRAADRPRTAPSSKPRSCR